MTSLHGTIPSIHGTRVLLVGDDRRFRSVVAALLHRRGYVVSVHERRDDLAGLVERSGADVVVLDTDGPRIIPQEELDELAALHPRVGLVVVGDGVGSAAPALAPVVDKWGPLASLSAAIDGARPAPGS